MVSGAFGNLRESAARPGPGAYNPSVVAPTGGGLFAKASRPLNQGDNGFANAIGKEKAYAYAHLPESDELDGLVAALQQKPAAAPIEPAPIDFGSPLRAPPPMRRPAPMPHNAYLRSIDTTPRLLHGNIFPNAAYVNNARQQYNRKSFDQVQYALPWQGTVAREPISRRFFHQPNEFSDVIAGAARMGIKPFGKDGR